MSEERVSITVRDGQAFGVSAQVKDGNLILTIPVVVLQKNVDEMTLTPAEREVMKWLVRGYTNKDMANIMELSIHTIRYHVQSILRKTQISRRELIKRGTNGKAEDEQMPLSGRQPGNGATLVQSTAPSQPCSR